MLTLLTPYILGVLIQFAAILGEKLVTLPANTPGSAASAQEEFSKNLDTAQFLPSLLTVIVGTALVMPDMNTDVTAIVFALAAVSGVWLGWKLRTLSASEYAAKSWPIDDVSILNSVMIATNFILGVVVYFTNN